MNVGCVGNVQVCVEVVWVGNVIEYKQESRFFQCIEYIVEMCQFVIVFDVGNDVLMFCVWCYVIELFVIVVDNFDVL